MDVRMISILFSLLQKEVCGGEVVMTDADKTYVKENLASLYALSKSHDVAHLVGHALAREGSLSPDDPFFRKFEKQQMLAIYRYEQSAYELQQICEVLEGAEIDYMPLKGAVIRDLYPEPWMRTSCDIDILIREEDLEKAMAALAQELGYEAESARNYHDISLHSPGGIHLELHFNILENMENIDRVLGKVWENAVPAVNGGHRFDQSTPYFLFHHIAHMAYHVVNGGCGIRPFLDLYVLQTKLSCDQEALHRFLQECEIEKFYEGVLQLKGVWLEGHSHNALTLQMQGYLLEGGVYGSLENKAAAVRQEGGKLRYVWARLFLPYETLGQYYPVLRRHKWLYPFMQVRRWGRLLFGGRMSASMRELSANQKVTKDKADEIKNFLSDLGL